MSISRNSLFWELVLFDQLSTGLKIRLAINMGHIALLRYIYFSLFQQLEGKKDYLNKGELSSRKSRSKP